jgi:iron complex outermembrane receptor protein
MLQCRLSPVVLRRPSAAFGLFALLAAVAPWAAHAQSPAPQPGAAAPAPQPATRVTLPPITVTAQKEPADVRQLPVSVTTVLQDALAAAGIFGIADAAIYAPNTYFADFTARKLSNPRFRGIGTSPANPGITTYIDGVPQLNTNSSSLDFLDVDQVEFVRGPQSALFGRNTLGGLINISSARPSLTRWTGRAFVPVGSESSREVRASASGPLADRLAVGVSFAHAQRDGFTTNAVTGNDLDSRRGTAAKAQLLWLPARNWEARVIVNGERARDGDYALHDLASLRERPHRAARDFEGHTNRDVFSTTLLARREGARMVFSSTTGLVRWKTDDDTDLDYTPLPLVTRSNAERDVQFTQEVRLASAANAPLRLSDAAALRWQAGAVLFTQRYEQEAVNTFAPFLLSPLLGVPVAQRSPEAALDDVGVGAYGQATVTLLERLDLTAGARFDFERKDARLETRFDPQIAPPLAVDENESFSNVSPQLAVAYRLDPSAMAYLSVGRGFKAGGFNPASPAGNEAYGEEYTWHVEGGLKSLWAGGRVATSLSAFHIDWDELQLNLPNPAVPAQFFIANVGGARSRGVELELTARPHASLDLFGAFGYTHARFGAGSVSSGIDVGGRKVPNTPDYTATVGAQLTRALRPGLSVYGRGEAVFYGAFEYDDANTARQDAYSLANLRAGVRGRFVFAEAWVRNAFDSKYIPVAFAYQAFAPSGFIGESGRPRTFGAGLGVTF